MASYAAAAAKTVSPVVWIRIRFLQRTAEDLQTVNKILASCKIDAKSLALGLDGAGGRRFYDIKLPIDMMAHLIAQVESSGCHSDGRAWLWVGPIPSGVTKRMCIMSKLFFSTVTPLRYRDLYAVLSELDFKVMPRLSSHQWSLFITLAEENIPMEMIIDTPANDIRILKRFEETLGSLTPYSTHTASGKETKAFVMLETGPRKLQERDLKESTELLFQADSEEAVVIATALEESVLAPTLLGIWNNHTDYLVRFKADMVNVCQELQKLNLYGKLIPRQLFPSGKFRNLTSCQLCSKRHNHTECSKLFAVLGDDVNYKLQTEALFKHRTEVELLGEERRASNRLRLTQISLATPTLNWVSAFNALVDPVDRIPIPKEEETKENAADGEWTTVKNSKKKSKARSHKNDPTLSRTKTNKVGETSVTIPRETSATRTHKSVVTSEHEESKTSISSKQTQKRSLSLQSTDKQVQPGQSTLQFPRKNNPVIPVEINLENANVSLTTLPLPQKIHQECSLQHQSGFSSPTSDYDYAEAQGKEEPPLSTHTKVSTCAHEENKTMGSTHAQANTMESQKRILPLQAPTLSRSTINTVGETSETISRETSATSTHKSVVTSEYEESKTSAVSSKQTQKRSLSLQSTDKQVQPGQSTRQSPKKTNPDVPVEINLENANVSLTTLPQPQKIHQECSLQHLRGFSSPTSDYAYAEAQEKEEPPLPTHTKVSTCAHEENKTMGSTHAQANTMESQKRIPTLQAPTSSRKKINTVGVTSETIPRETSATSTHNKVVTSAHEESKKSAVPSKQTQKRSPSLQPTDKQVQPGQSTLQFPKNHNPDIPVETTSLPPPQKLHQECVSTMSSHTSDFSDAQDEDEHEAHETPSPSPAAQGTIIARRITRRASDCADFIRHRRQKRAADGSPDRTRRSTSLQERKKSQRHTYLEIEEEDIAENMSLDISRITEKSESFSDGN